LAAGSTPWRMKLPGKSSGVQCSKGNNVDFGYWFNTLEDEAILENPVECNVPKVRM